MKQLRESLKFAEHFCHHGDRLSKGDNVQNLLHGNRRIYRLIQVGFGLSGVGTSTGEFGGDGKNTENVDPFPSVLSAKISP